MTDAAHLVDAICFEAAHAMSGQAYILREQAHLDSLYDQIDGSRVCRRPIERRSFDFGGRAIIGTWTYAPHGCVAQHDLLQIRRDDDARTVALRYRFAVEGDCPYELIRPLWVAIENADGYDLRLEITG